MSGASIDSTYPRERFITAAATARRNRGSTRINRYRAVAALVVAVACTGCATTAGVNRGAPDDPLEQLNRVVLDANTALDSAVIRPLAEVYRQVIPPFVRDRVRSVLDNLAEPRIFVNNVLQGRANAAGITFFRFITNTVVGIAGLFDLATAQGFPRQSGDFGQTLYVFGVGDGPYLVLPLFGPSNLRDAFGLGVDIVTTPPGLIGTGHAGTVTGLAVGIIDGLDLRSRNIETLDEIVAGALDYYSYLKSITRQQRQAQLREAKDIGGEDEELIDPGASPAKP